MSPAWWGRSCEHGFDSGEEPPTDLLTVFRTVVRRPFTSTTLGVVATTAALDPAGCLMAAQGGQDGLARVIAPAHLASDGDAVVAASVGGADAPVDLVRVMAEQAVAAAVRTAVAA